MLKYKYRVLFLLFLSIININIVLSKSFPLMGKIIVIDPGHGGKDSGAYYYNTYESNLNYELSLNLKKQLENKGANVYLTRNGNYDLSSPKTFRRKKSDFDNRLAFINSINPDLVITVHMNASDINSLSGMQIFYSNNDTLAKYIFNSVKPRRKLKKIKNIYFLDHLKYPNILIEYGFISNNNDLNLVKSKEYQFSINEKIIKGLIKYFN